MNENATTAPFRGRFLFWAIALFVIGLCVGSFVVYLYEIRLRSIHADANAPTKRQQTPMTVAATQPMPEMGDTTNAVPPRQNADSASNQNMLPGTIQLNPDQQQLIGLRFTEARRIDMQRTIRTTGLVKMDEEKISRIHVKVSGWIDKMYLDSVGQFVKRGQPLYTLYSPDLVSTEQEYLIALKGNAYLSDVPFADASSGANSLLRATRDRLRLWDVTDSQIRKLEATGKVERTTMMYSPSTGFVMARNAYAGSSVTPETDLYDIADLSTIWVDVDIFEYEAPFVHIGQAASMQLSYLPGKNYSGHVTYVYPTLDPKTRTLKVRLQFANPGFALKPDMYADVQLQIHYGMQVVVPSEAVLNSGTRQVVFIARPGGYFEPREIKIGNQFDGQSAVLAGLKPGEKIVASGNFLIDSETRLGSAMQGMGGMSAAPAPKQ